jgi:hypothetical protein
MTDDEHKLTYVTGHISKTAELFKVLRRLVGLMQFFTILNKAG